MEEQARRSEALRRAGALEPPALLDQLAQRVAGGERDALAAIFELLSDDVYTYAYHLSGDAEMAEDVVTETFLAAWRSAGTYRAGSGTYRAWLLRIARNQVRDTWKNARRERAALAQLAREAEDRVAHDVPGPHAEDLARLLAELTDDQREVIVLRYVAGMSTREVAETLGKREGAVRSLANRAIQRLRRYAGGDWANHLGRP